MKKGIKIYIRSLVLSTSVLLCCLIVIFGIGTAYEGMQMMMYGQKRNAVEIIHGVKDNITTVRILDFEFTY